MITIAEFGTRSILLRKCIYGKCEILQAPVTTNQVNMFHFKLILKYTNKNIDIQI